jgi:hypothetical protein
MLGLVLGFVLEAAASDQVTVKDSLTPPRTRTRAPTRALSLTLTLSLSLTLTLTLTLTGQVRHPLRSREQGHLCARLLRAAERDAG